MRPRFPRADSTPGKRTVASPSGRRGHRWLPHDGFVVASSHPPYAPRRNKYGHGLGFFSQCSSFDAFEDEGFDELFLESCNFHLESVGIEDRDGELRGMADATQAAVGHFDGSLLSLAD